MTTFRTCIPTSTSTKRRWRPSLLKLRASVVGRLIVRVLGIDCGTERTGWGVIDSDGRSHRVLAHGVIRTAVKSPLEQRLAKIAQGLRAVLQDHQPDSAAVEEVFYSQNVKTALKLAHVRGVALLAIAAAPTRA